MVTDESATAKGSLIADTLVVHDAAHAQKGSVFELDRRLQLMMPNSGPPSQQPAAKPNMTPTFRKMMPLTALMLTTYMWWTKLARLGYEEGPILSIH